jgi:hypothetical protein
MTAAERIEDLPAGLDWQAFSARCFPDAGRHQHDALAAYGHYRKLLGKIAEGEATTEAESAAKAVEAWEDEGGSAS